MRSSTGRPIPPRLANHVNPSGTYQLELQMNRRHLIQLAGGFAALGAIAVTSVAHAQS
jgi:hypothetical protein